jgi:thioredoxin-related protein
MNGTGSSWKTNLEEAKKEAKQKNVLILLNFSGSDWCAPCIRWRKEVLDHADFIKYAESNLILVNADFPRLKKNALPKAQVKANEAVAEKYNPKGKFPFTCILDANGNLLKTYDGFVNIPVLEFINQIKALKNAAHP